MIMKAKALTIVAVLIAVLIASATPLFADKQKRKSQEAVVRPAESIQYKEVMKGISKAHLWGKSRGTHGALTKFAAGTKVPMHTHSTDIRIIVVSGTIITGDPEGKETRLGPGSYRFTPAGYKHMTSCAEGAECLLYEEMPGEFDLIMVDKAK
jgi:quercetin dioxygenase-like cupin family protein